MLKVARKMTTELTKYERMLSDNPDLAKLVPYRIKAKGALDRARVEKVLQSTVCNDTITLLRDNHQQWMQDPALFWKGPSPCPANSSDPQVQIVGRILQTSHDDV
jgi:hypothetical protein